MGTQAGDDPQGGQGSDLKGPQAGKQALSSRANQGESSSAITQECFCCGEKGHRAQDCNKPKKCVRCGLFGHLSDYCRTKLLCDYIAPFCAAQVEGQGFFYIPDRPFESTLKERSSTAVVTVLSGKVDPRRIENEFRSILGPNVWRWTTKLIAENKFTVRFPTAQLIKEWGYFRPLGMRTAPAQIAIDPWNSSIGAKAEFQQAWFRVRGIPYDKRNVQTLAYVGSLVGVTVDIDEKSINRQDYVRMKICCRDVTKVPESAAGLIIPYLRDFFFEREVEIPSHPNAIDIAVSNSNNEGEHQSKKPRMENANQGGSSGQGMTGKRETGCQFAPPKFKEKGIVLEQVQVFPKQKLMADAQKSFISKPEHKDKEEGDKLQDFDDFDSDDEYDGLYEDEIEQGEPSNRQVMLVKCSTTKDHNIVIKGDSILSSIPGLEEQNKEKEVTIVQEMTIEKDKVGCEIEQKTALEISAL